MTTKSSTATADIARVAFRFDAMLRRDAGKHYSTIIARNSLAAANEPSCASHDFVDANMTMMHAMQACGFGTDINDDAIVAMWNAAWDMWRNSTRREVTWFAGYDGDTDSDYTDHWTREDAEEEAAKLVGLNLPNVFITSAFVDESNEEWCLWDIDFDRITPATPASATATPLTYMQQWQSDLRAAVNARDGEGMASMMKNHDPNGCYSYADCVEECGVTTRDEWIDMCIQTATDIYLTDEYRNDCN